MAGVYIQGMEMPTCCYACPLRKQHGEKIVCPICGESFSVTVENRLSHQLKNCPLIPVPEHGRLIDGDELAAGCDDPYWCRWLSEIEDAPVIIPADKEDN